MPLFHIHGLMAAVLATLAAGASVICTPGFNALRFFAWLDELQPSWYTAVPTMHQAILARAARNQAIVERARLRVIRSSSASLPPQVMADLERLFRCPVIESLRHDRGRPSDGEQSRCRRRRASPARSESRPGPRSRS